MLSVISVLGLAGCGPVTEEEEVNEVVNHQADPLDKEELTKRILLLKPEWEDELNEESTEVLQELYEALMESREADIQNRIQEVDEGKQLKEEDWEHHHDPNPPDPPIYEKPRPVPDPPIEEE